MEGIRLNLAPALRDPASFFESRVTVFAGHFGSGKTELALNASIATAGVGQPTALVDLDVVKPYFRSRSAQAVLAQHGVELVAPQGDLMTADLPLVCADVRVRLADPAKKVFVDAGGNDIGVKALSSVLDALPTHEASVLLVLNFRRPFTPDVPSAIAMARAIEGAARLKFTGVISNTHLIQETTPSVVLEGYGKALEVASQMGLPLLAVSVETTLAGEVQERGLSCPLFAVNRYVRPPFEKKDPVLKVRKVGPIFKMG
jgi:hypothetical protein